MGYLSPPSTRLSSFQLNLVLGVIAILPAVPAPFPGWPTLDTTLGWCLYVGAVLVLVVTLVRAGKTEDRIRTWERGERDAATESRHQAIMTGQRQQTEQIVAFFNEAVAARAAVAQTGPIGVPLLNAIATSGSLVTRSLATDQRYVAAVTAMQGYAGPTGPHGPPQLAHLTEATNLLHEIAQVPPTGPDAVRIVATKLEQYFLEAEPGAFVITGGDATLTHQDSDGRVIGDT